MSYKILHGKHFTKNRGLIKEYDSQSHIFNSHTEIFLKLITDIICV